MTGNAAAAFGVKLARVEVIATYPITPQSPIVEYIAELIANGQLKAELINTESEHSAMSACIGASLCGARVFTGTASQGLTLMHEMLHWASGARTPIVMPVANRGLAVPWNLYADHQDSMSQRDTGWIKFYCETNQEVLDTVIQAYRIAEDKRVLLPVMISLDAFLLSHTTERVETPEQEQVDGFLPPYKPEFFYVDPDRPLAENVVVMPDWYMEFRYQQERAMQNAKDVIKKVAKEYYNLVGRRWGDLIEVYKVEDAEVAVVAMGTIAGTSRAAVDKLREQGKKVGLVKLRCFRPFPTEDLRKACSNIKGLAVFDRSYSFGSYGAAHTEVKSAFYNAENKPLILGVVAGLGGRDVTIDDIVKILNKILESTRTTKLEQEVVWLNLRRRG